MTRHEMREAVFIITFERVFDKNDIDEIIELAKEVEYFEKPINDKVEKMAKAVDQNVEAIDEVIAKNLNKWTIDRISKVSLAVLRIAVYEMTIEKDVEDDIVISEAVKITQAYSLKDDVKFVNGILASISKGK